MQEKIKKDWKFQNFDLSRNIFKQEAQRATVAHLSTMNARKILEWNQKQEAQRAL